MPLWTRIATILLAAAAAIAPTSALNVLVNNDDGFGAANIRELYRVLVDAGHNVVMVAPATQQSGQGGRSVFTDSGTLYTATQYNIVPAGAPAVGRDPIDSNIWYYNGTPAACTFVALDYVIPTFYENRTTDLLVSGPNFGNNLGSFVWTLSGTAGASYSAVGRNLPAIAFSAGNSQQRAYTEINATTPSGHADPATIGAQLSLKIIEALANNTAPGERLLPLGYGLNVNWAEIDTLAAEPKCIEPTFYQTRFTGGAVTDVAIRNATTGVFRYGNLYTEAMNTCINGNCTLPGETEIVNSGCYGSVSLFTIDYTGPSGRTDDQVRSKLDAVVMKGTPSAAQSRRGLSSSAYAGSVKRRHD